MDRELTAQQQDYMSRMESIYEQKLKPYLEEWDAMGGAQVAVRMPEQWVDFWAALRDNDFTGLRIPKKYGGPELDLYTVGLLIEHACYISRSGSWSQLFTQNDCPTEMLRQVGTEAQRERYLGRMREGGMAVTVGQVRQIPDGVGFVVLGHNTIRGAAGAAILNAELYISEHGGAGS